MGLDRQREREEISLWGRKEEAKSKGRAGREEVGGGGEGEAGSRHERMLT